MSELEARFQRLDLRGQGFGITGVSLEHLDRDGAAIGSA
jgi:hypothetical protein